MAFVVRKMINLKRQVSAKITIVGFLWRNTVPSSHYLLPQTTYSLLSLCYYKGVESCDSSYLEQLAKDGMQYVNIEVHPMTLKMALLQDLTSYAASGGFHIITTPEVDKQVIRWTRTVPRKIMLEGGKVGLTESRVNMLRAIYVATAEEVAGIMASDKHGLRTTLDTKLRDLGGGRMTLAVIGMQHYRSVARLPTADLEMAIIDVLVGLSMDVEMFESSDELYTCIVEISKAMAEMPSKMAKRRVDEMADFYMRGEKKDCIIVDSDGRGLSRLWQQMLSVVPQSSLETSRSLAAEFPSPRALAQALSSEKGESQVAGVRVARSNMPDARARRVGPEMARVLRDLTTQTDGNRVIEKIADTG